MAKSFAHLLKRHRVAAGLSQETLAERTGVSVDTISYLERDERHAPHKATLDLLIAALSLDDDSRRQIEEVAKLARARGPRAQRRGAFSDPRAESPPNNLPAQLTSFVDRESVVEEIKELLQSSPLVTVVGTGGAGKTRCAIKIAAEALDGFGDGFWLAELAPISDPALVAGVIARSLRIQEAPNRPILDTLLLHLKRKRLLLILDNCEHVIDEARRVVAAILHGCPDVRILATSRESLNIAGEQAYRLPSLPVPSTSELPSADNLSQFGAVQLFTDRALSADNAFILTIESAPHVAEICRRLDGIPLAIELAAARIKVLSALELAQKLDERFRLLTAGDRSALPRHRTMRALIDWSYDLLADDEGALFRKLSIFAGGFTLETVGAMCGDFEMDEIVVLDLLSSLVDKSLVQTEVVGVDTRYRLLESTREYAREKLRDAGEEDAVARAHARAFATIVEELHDVYDTTPDRQWFARIEPELENFRAALSWAFGPHGDALLGQRMAGGLRPAWTLFGAAEGRRWVEAAQQRVTSNTPAAAVAALDLAQASFASALTEHKASLEAGTRALARYRELDDRFGIAAAELQIGRAQINIGDIPAGEALTQRALEVVGSFGARRSVMFGLLSLAFARQFAGDLPGARQRFSETLSVAQSVGADRYAAATASNLAEAEYRGGDAATALRLVDEAVAVLSVFGDTRLLAHSRYNKAAYLVALRRYDEARSAAREALSAARDLQWPVGLAWIFQRLAAIGALRPGTDVQKLEDCRRAACILGYADARLTALEALREYTEQQEYDAMLPLLRDTLGEDQLAQLMTEGRTWSEDQAVTEAMLM